MYFDFLQLILVIPKSIQAFLFIVNLILLNKKFQNTPWSNRPQLHKLILIGIFGWIIYITLDIFIYIFAAVSFEGVPPPAFFEGYTKDYPSLLIVNILRDVGFLGALTISWMYLMASFSLRFGERRTREIFQQNKLVILAINLISSIIVIGDRIGVSITENGPKVKAVYNGFSGTSILLTVVIYFTSAVLLSQTFKRISNGDESGNLKKRLTYLSIGIMNMGFGHIYWFILGQIAMFNPALFSNFNHVIFLYVFGHLIWMLSPIFIYLGLSKYQFDDNS
jgi:hypothetical protein